ncbi:MAG: hypothetical protein C0418_06335 [Coriobacteriaceae bacterium]|nr:hypothetical protein [Coriobacteriaceae bacterium]
MARNDALRHVPTTTASLAAALAVTLLLAGCSLVGDGPKYSADDLMRVWSAHPEAANWDLEVRDVVGQRKSTGSHDANYTIFLTTYTNKKVPAFKMYETADVPNDDSMTFDERAKAFFDVVAAGSEFSGVTDREAFMTWYAEQYPDKRFVRLIQNMGEGGASTWELVAYDADPTESTMSEKGRTGIMLAYDDATKNWTAK